MKSFILLFVSLSGCACSNWVYLGDPIYVGSVQTVNQDAGPPRLIWFGPQQTVVAEQTPPMRTRGSLEEVRLFDPPSNSVIVGGATGIWVRSGPSSPVVDGKLKWSAVIETAGVFRYDTLTRLYGRPVPSLKCALGGTLLPFVKAPANIEDVPGWSCLPK